MRLIDADALKEAVAFRAEVVNTLFSFDKTMQNNCKSVEQLFIKEIDKAPTIGAEMHEKGI